MLNIFFFVCFEKRSLSLNSGKFQTLAVNSKIKEVHLMR